MDGDDSGWMNSLDFGQRLLKEPRPRRVGWQQRETCSYFQGKGSSDIPGSGMLGRGRSISWCILLRVIPAPSTGDIPWPQHSHIFPLFPATGTSVQSPVLPAAPGALLETFPGNLESWFLPAATSHLITEPEHFWPALGHCFRGSGWVVFSHFKAYF